MPMFCGIEYSNQMNKYSSLYEQVNNMGRNTLSVSLSSSGSNTSSGNLGSSTGSGQSAFYINFSYQGVGYIPSASGIF